MTFQDLNLHSGILKAIDKLGHTEPTPIQLKVIPKILKGFDIRASAQTGTGKTAAFLLPALNQIMSNPAGPGQGPRVLILVPTRELALQVSKQAELYSQFLSKVKTVCIFGGTPYPVQIRQLSRPYEILVATPGRLIDHMSRGKISFSRLELLILDEADRMLDMGFIGPVEQIAEATPKSRQTLMFSATLKGSVLKLSQRLLNKPMEISVQSETISHENIEQQLHFVDNLDHKYQLLDHVINTSDINQAIIFTATKSHAEELRNRLRESGRLAGALHGDMDQRQRLKTIAKVREGEIRYLVATDVAARGLDILTISHVINFDLPHSSEDYVHRIGRTGRAGAKGIALSFVSGHERHLLKKIEQFTNHKMESKVVPGLEPKNKSEMPSKKRRPFKRHKSPSGSRFGKR